MPRLHRPPSPAGAAGASGLARVRRLQLAQFALVMLMAVVVTALVVTSARTLLDATAKQRRADTFLRDLTTLRDDGRMLQVRFWVEQREGGGPSVSPRLLRDVLAFGARTRALAERQRMQMHPDAATDGAARRSVALFRLIESGAGVMATSPDPVLRRGLLDMADGLSLRVSDEHNRWVVLRRAAAERAGRDLDRTIRAVTVRAVVVAGLLSAVGMLLWILLTRARNRVLAHIEGAAREQSALRSVAETVASEAPREEVFGALAAEVVNLTGGDAAWVIDADAGVAEVVGADLGGDAELAPIGTGSRAPVLPGGLLAGVLEGRGPVRVTRDPALPEPVDDVFRRTGMRAGVASPIRVSGRTWGAVVVLSRDPARLPARVEERLEPFARLAGVAVGNAEARRRLAERAATDSLTGLPNHGAFHARLREEAGLALRHGRPLALAVLDLDHFKEVNDAHGHQAGDRVLAEVAARLRAAARDGEMVARIGGEEFGWLMPGTDAGAAVRAAERGRAAVAGAVLAGGVRLSASAGVCDLDLAGTPAELFRLADAALLSAKAQGRDMTVRHDPEADEDGSPRAERARTLAALRALARAVDARDPATQRHSERVADLTHRIAVASGWSGDRAHALREAALVHDVGKIGIPDAILLKPAALTREEFARVAAHAELGATIVHEVLTAEQVGWVRHHHERIDGGGYPAGLASGAIPEGARILATADAWDAMTTDRPYRTARTVGEALEECARVAGTQLDPLAVAVLERVVAADAGADAPEAGVVAAAGAEPY
ncbi:MAG: diguanylate cyclase [Thermoleophilia bacterium]|nr:diguanylate cyclase [Thermoleophilia bacterium]